MPLPAIPAKPASTGPDTALRIVLIEDDALLRDRILLPGLANYGFAVDGLETAAELERHLLARVTDIVVLDVGLPDADGFEVARGLRQRFADIGIVMLTGRGETPDRVRGLSQGADAYLSKPVEIELLAATLHTLARRVHRAPPVAAVQAWRLDAHGWCLLTPVGESIALTKTERRLLQPLVAAGGNVVVRETLIAALTDNVHDFDPHRIDSMIHRLRRKVADACGAQLPLLAVHGEGYVFNA
jgi:DNA-binding response OmpR family regulator